ncbi:MAG: inorganic phosphate transporter, PiT family [Miltoncostaeaceae bacterium]|jgi:PiT family inorganic phosphate transporter|nr:inorganic phosphate transporter, PiT family [Miltoncostaeaceae bacterium]
MELTLVLVVALALAFDFTNGFHDSANAVATSIATKAIRPRVAVAGAAVLNFAGAFVSLEVAATVGKGIVDPSAVTLGVIMAGLSGAIAWNLTSWRLGLPTSSSHALIGGVAGAAIAASGLGIVNWTGLKDKVMIPSLAAPVAGLAIAGGLAFLLLRIVRRRDPEKVGRIARRGQLISASFVAFTHGTNDAQKTMGVIALALVAGQPASEFHVPLWVMLSAAAAMAAGTYVGGWRIIRTLGTRLTELSPVQGFAAETSTAAILWSTAHLGFPVSTTHTISGSVLGAGAAGRQRVGWVVARNIGVAWLVTIPAAALTGALLVSIERLPAGPVLVAALTAAMGLIAWRSRERPPEAPPAPPAAATAVAPPPAPVRS